MPSSNSATTPSKDDAGAPRCRRLTGNGAGRVNQAQFCVPKLFHIARYMPVDWGNEMRTYGAFLLVLTLLFAACGGAVDEGLGDLRLRRNHHRHDTTG